MKDQDWTPVDAALDAMANGYSRLEAFKSIHECWGTGPFTVDDLEKYTTATYPSTSARAAATVGLAALVLNYPRATIAEFAAFEASTGISRKVEALTMADRADDALRFYDRLDTASLRLRPIDENDARRAVSLAIGEHQGLIAIDDTKTQTHDWGWLYMYEFADYLETGAPAAKLSGSAPLIFDRFTGALIETAQGADPTASCERYSATGWPV